LRKKIKLYTPFHNCGFTKGKKKGTTSNFKYKTPLNKLRKLKKSVVITFVTRNLIVILNLFVQFFRLRNRELIYVFNILFIIG